jgi:hypothetical protein
MSKKSKTSEINDIIDSSYAEPDYDEEIDNYRYRNTYRSSYELGSGSVNPFSKISTTRSLAPANTSQVNTNTSNTSNTSNIFMKYTSPKTNTEIGDKNATTSITTEIKNTEEEFPSLGGAKKTTIQTPAPMNFKKIVETKKVTEVQPQVVQKKPKCDDYSTLNHRLKAYEEVKYYSERTARSKIHRSGYSDNYDDDDDDDDDDEYVEDYDDD